MNPEQKQNEENINTNNNDVINPQTVMKELGFSNNSQQQ